MSNSDTQLGGHAGATLVTDGKLLKKCGHASEAEYYQATLGHAKLKPFIPEFFGLEEREDGQYLIMNDILDGFKRPMMLDLKMGTRTYGDDADEDKRTRQIKKASKTTSITCGCAIVGCRIPTCASGETYEMVGRKSETGEVSTEEALIQVLTRFLRTDRLKKEARDFIVDLHAYFSEQKEYAYYGSSLFFAYDAAEENESTLRVKMIDFAHVHPTPDGGRDESYLTGLDFLLNKVL